MVCTVDRIAALKILLHSAKYPSSSVNGVLLGPSPAEASSQGSAPNTHDEGPSSVHVTDAIPLFHSFLTLAPSLETALFQVDALCRSKPGVKVVGYYHANELLTDLDLKPMARRLADRIQQQQGQAVTLLVDNGKLGAFADNASQDILQLWTSEGKGWGRSAASKLNCQTEGLRDLYVDALLQGRHQQLCDFDDHLNDIAKDWTNSDFQS